MNKENKMIPELRFPEFEKDGEWNECILENICGMQAGKFVRASDINEKKTEGLYPCFGGNGLRGFTKSYTHSGQYSLIGRQGALCGNIKLAKGEFYATEHAVVVTPKKEADTLWLYYELNLLNLNQYATGQAQPGLSVTNLEKVKLKIPKSFNEQQKIAACLSSLDDLIEAHNQKLEALKNHKKGLMQNLFPQNGEKVPKFRFPEFVNDGEWVENTLDNLATFSKGKGISKSDITVNGNLPCIRYGELYTNYQETITEIYSYTNLAPEDLILSQANDVIIPASGETQIDIATASCVLVDGIALGGDLNIIRTNINGVFLSYYLNNAKKMEIAQMAQGISVVHLYPNQLKTLKVCIPDTLEQIKIADTLSSLDTLIGAQSNKIKQLKEHKKGLMQGLFVTAK